MKTTLLSIQKFISAEKLTLSEEERKTLVARIDNEVTAVDIDQVTTFVDFLDNNRANYHSPSANTPGYFVFSTAPFNTEDGEADVVVDRTPALKDSVLDQFTTFDNPLKLPIREQTIEERNANLNLAIQQIADDLHERRKNPDISPELVIAIHGYSTEQTNVRRWYKRIYKYVNQKALLNDIENSVFVGYRWSSESVEFGLRQLRMAIKALPILPKILAGVGIGLTILWIVLIVRTLSQTIDLLLAIALSLSVFAAAIVLCLVILRVIVYFRDAFRASNFGVPDLVEFVRLLDLELQTRAEKEYPDETIRKDRLKRINLNFIAHSMGAFVVTNVIRILSDVFDPAAVNKEPSSRIGKVFCLNRLVLVSPDIPVLAIAASRANYLASSLRRFDEAYLFSNEGDLALRLASTTANYFSYPSNSRESGYRLGNASITPGRFGIINLQNLQRYCYANSSLFGAVNSPGPAGNFQKDTALHFLFTTNLDGGTPGSLADVAKRRGLNADVNDFTIADLFTYFDCTDYVETSNDPAFDIFIAERKSENKKYAKFVKRLEKSNLKIVGVLSRAICMIGTRPKQRSLNFFDYAGLLFDFLNGRDVHGGYFDAPFSKDLIYQLAFIGFKSTLERCAFRSSPITNPQIALDAFDRKCQEYGIQVILSPLRYSVDIQGNDPQAAKKELIHRIEGT
ncbi:alpha/beta hydrolase [Phormidium tenue FACHB-886]|nr:alpha/beta hydrolase [Phormidium tenue FACHB-886]